MRNEGDTTSRNVVRHETIIRHHRWNGIRQEIARLRDLELLFGGFAVVGSGEREDSLHTVIAEWSAKSQEEWTWTWAIEGCGSSCPVIMIV